MANALYGAFKQEQDGDAAGPGHGPVDWEADDVRLILVDQADYTVNLATHQDLVDVPAGARVAVSAASLANKTAVYASGNLDLDSDAVTLSSVTGDQAEEVVLYKHTGTEATSLLIAYYDTFGSGMPVTPNGGDITVTPNASGWIRR